MNHGRKCAVPTAQGWFDSAREAQAAGKMGEALLFMENAFNHTENALFAARKALAPFANRAARFDERPGISAYNDDVELWQNGNWRCDLTVGDLRQARVASGGDRIR
jgi:hypothetical protein